MIPTLLLPPSLFPVDMQPMIYFVILPLIIGALLFKDLIAWFIIYPEEARTYILNRFYKRPLIDYETEDGVRHLETAKIFPEGFVIGDKSKNIYLMPRPAQIPVLKRMLQGEGGTKKQIETIVELISKMEKRTLTGGLVKGLGVRIFRAYQSVGIAATMAQLVGLSYDSNEKNAFMLVPVVSKTGHVVNPTDLCLNKNKKVGEWFVDVHLPVNSSILQKVFGFNYTQNQLIALFRKGIEIGEKKNNNPLGKWLIYIIVIVLIVGVAALLATLFLSGGGTPT